MYLESWYLSVGWPCESLKRRPGKILLSRYSESIPRCCQTKHVDQEKPATSPPFCEMLVVMGVKAWIYRIQAPSYNSFHFHSFPLLPCLNWGDSRKVCLDTALVFPLTRVRCSHSSFLVHWPSWYMTMRKSQRSARLERGCQIPYLPLLMASHQRI